MQYSFKNMMDIGGILIGNDKPCYIIAEIGINHNGDIALAKKLIDVATNAGANAVKFQKRDLESIYQQKILENPSLDSQGTEILIDVLKNNAGDKWKVGSIERFKFYEEAKQAYMIVSTTDARAFGCFIITKGVIKPDGSVW